MLYESQGSHVHPRNGGGKRVDLVAPVREGRGQLHRNDPHAVNEIGEALLNHAKRISMNLD